MELSIIIPMYNERAIAADTVRTLAGAMERANLPGGYEILFSDDGSSDGCAEIVEKNARELSLTNGLVRVVRAEKNYGKGHAVRAGMLSSHGDVCVFTDCDLAYGTDVLPTMLDRLKSLPDAGVLIGSRAIAENGYEGYTLLRKIASKVYVRLLCTAAGFRCSDSQCGIKMFRGDAARKIFALAEVDGWAFDFEILLLAEKLGYSIAEHPVKVINHRKSKIHLLRDSMKMASDVRKIRKRVDALTL